MNGARSFAVAAGTVFDGAEALPDFAVIVDGSQVVALRPRREVDASIPMHRLPNEAWLAPGFIDVQVNGGGDALFNEVPTAQGISTIAAAHRRFGTTALLPTLISDTPDKMRCALAAVQGIAKENPSVLGIHFEGPFLSPEKTGVHDPSVLRAPSDRDLDLLTSWPSGIVLVTLAPERTPDGFIHSLARSGVRVSLGHSMATYTQAKVAIAEGLTGFTHLFNAMRPLASREPGPIAAALETPGVWFGMIVDGEHVAPPMLRMALRGAAKPMLVTDAMPPVGGKASSFKLYGQAISVRDGSCVRDDGTLAGAALDMASAVRNAVQLLGVPLTSALRFASRMPAEFLGLGQKLGRLAPGFRADMVAFEPLRIDVLATWVAGQLAGNAIATE
jgi:N-acetylglucosamine-6-phosphate deacetylase